MLGGMKESRKEHRIREGVKEGAKNEKRWDEMQNAGRNEKASDKTHSEYGEYDLGFTGLDGDGRYGRGGRML